MNISRLLKHLSSPGWILGRSFPAAVLDRIEQSIRGSEQNHRGELRFAIEAGLDFWPLVRGLTPRDRAVEVFAAQRVWDTAENIGVLVYVQCVDHAIEIVADRGISAQVPEQAWNDICARMEQAFRARRFEEGALAGIREITGVLTRYFPADGANPNELPDRPVVL